MDCNAQPVKAVLMLLKGLSFLDLPNKLTVKKASNSSPIMFSLPMVLQFLLNEQH